MEATVYTAPEFDLDVLNDYAQRGLLRRQHHPSIPLTIWNYSATVPYSKAWDAVTLACRGIVTDEEGRVVMRSFPKFFNLEEVDALPSGPFSASVKMDGSLILATWRGADWLVASRGSFTSQQAVWGEELLNEMDLADVMSGLTYVFELIHPENRIVVDYGARRELVLLGIIHTEGGSEWPRYMWPERWTHVEEAAADGLAPADLKALNAKNEEGYVLRFEDGTRVKVKFEEYVRLHRIVTGVSTKTIWGHLRDGKPLAGLLEHVPDEFNDWVRAKEEKYSFDAYCLLEYARGVVDKAARESGRKAMALSIQTQLKDFGEHRLSSVCFSLLDGNEEQARLGTYKLIEPKYEQPFADRGEA